MIANFTNFLSNMDRNSQFLLILIFIIVFLLILIFIINSINAKRAKKYIEKQNAYKRKLREEIELESKNITAKPIVVTTPKVVEEEIEVLDDAKDDIDVIMDDLKASESVSTFNLTDFEREQEETAIISYEELCKKHGVEQKIYNKEEKNIIEKVNDIVENKIESQKFRPTQYVSPIFGLQQEEANDQAFLTNLKEFRNGLE